MRITGYCRVSTKDQEASRQESDLKIYAQDNKMMIDDFVIETVSSKKKDRKIFSLIETLQKNDVLLVTELSRLGRSIIEVQELTSKAIGRGVVIKITSPSSAIDKIDGSIQSQTMLFALSLSAQLERDFISERTKSALQQKKREGIILGRPIGQTAIKGKEDMINNYLEMGLNKSAIAKLIGVSRGTLYKYISNRARG